jgi:hypothetical protein
MGTTTKGSQNEPDIPVMKHLPPSLFVALVTTFLSDAS